MSQNRIRDFIFKSVRIFAKTMLGVIYPPLPVAGLRVNKLGFHDSS